MKQRTTCGLTVAVALAAAILAPARLEAEPRVKPGQTVADLMASSPEKAPQPAPAIDPRDTMLGVGMWAGCVVLGALGVLGYRRLRARAATGVPAAGIEVVGRTMLSRRHSLLVVRTQGKRIAVAIAGDHVTSLGMWDDAGVADVRPEKPAAGAVAEKTGGFAIRPQDREAVEAARRFRDTDLLPYRQQVERLRGLLRGLKPGADEAASAEEPRP